MIESHEIIVLAQDIKFIFFFEQIGVVYHHISQLDKGLLNEDRSQY